VLDPQTPRHRAMVGNSSASLQPPANPLRAILDPKGSAIFWVAAAALLGLVLVTGRLRVEAAVGGRAGRS
jgi:hypothetical protein